MDGEMIPGRSTDEWQVRMLNLPRWQTIGITSVTVLAVIFAMPDLPTALIAGVLLFGFGSGPIRGFATSLTRPTELPI
jgi:hypothetical protein